MSYISPFSVHVLWHPAYSDGHIYFKKLYSELCRNADDPLSRRIGIPIFKRSESAGTSATPLPIPFEEADHNAVIVFVDDELFNDSKWEEYLNTIIQAKGHKRIYPIAISKHAGKMKNLTDFQHINLYTLEGDNAEETFNIRFQRLILNLLHDFSRQLLNPLPESEEVTPPRVKLFISHAKKDGETIAADFRDYVRSKTKLDSFFDVNDIPDSYSFSKEIEEAISKNAVVVIFQTDAYASREWCRREVILAKRFKAAIVVVNAIKDFERRSFPYMGNVPVMRWKKDFEAVIDKALYQILYHLVSELTLQKNIELYMPGREDVEYTVNSPELFNFVDIIRVQQKKNLTKLFVIYPDPPLGMEEVQLLNEIDKEVEFLTPVMLSNLS